MPRLSLTHPYGISFRDCRHCGRLSKYLLNAIDAMTSSTAQLSSGLEQVLVILREHQEEWRQRYQLQRIGLFGSTARDQATTTSDADVWVELDPLIPFATVHLKQELELLLQRPIDLVRLRKRMNPSLRAAILQEGVTA